MTLKGKTIFITGGAGFIGTSLIKHIIEENEVIVYDNGHRNALKDAAFANHPHLTFIHGDVLDAPRLAASLKGAQIVCHMAAIAGVDTVLQVPVRTMKINFLGTLNILEALLHQPTKIERFIDFSTSEVFGTHVYHAEEKSDTTLGKVGEARWTYAVSKLASEHLVHNFGKEYDLPVAIIRPFNVFGPGQVGVGAIHTFVVRALKGLPLEIHGDGSQIRAWCFIEDMVDGLLLVMSQEEAVGHVFNIGNPRGTVTIMSLAEKIKLLANSSSPITFINKEYVDVELRVPSIEKARKILGFEPKVDLEEGLLKTIAWYRQKLEKEADREIQMSKSKCQK